MATAPCTARLAYLGNACALFRVWSSLQEAIHFVACLPTERRCSLSAHVVLGEGGWFGARVPPRYRVAVNQPFTNQARPKPIERCAEYAIGLTRSTPGSPRRPVGAFHCLQDLQATGPHAPAPSATRSS